MTIILQRLFKLLVHRNQHYNPSDQTIAYLELRHADNILFCLPMLIILLPMSRELDEEMKNAVHDYLEKRRGNDELSAFLS